MRIKKVVSDVKDTASSAKPSGVQVKSVSGVGNINVGLKAKSPEPANAPAQAKAAKAKASGMSFAKGAKDRLKKASKPKAAKPVKAKAPKTKVAQDAPATDLSKAPLAEAGSSDSKRRLMLVGGTGALVLLILGMMLFGGSDETAPVAQAPVAETTVAAEPIVTTEPTVTPAPVVEPVTSVASTTTSTETNDATQQLMGGIISALRTSEAPAAIEAAPAATDSQLTSVSNLAKIVVTAMEQGQSEGYIQQLLNEAQARGDIVVPAPLLRADGTVDTATILSLFAKN